MKVSEIMTKKVVAASTEDTVQEAAKKMAGLNAGALPIVEDDRLVGMITDRDIAVKGVAGNKGLDAKVRDIMTPEVRYCFDDQEIDDVMRNMGELQVRRMPVVNRDKNVVGILSLGDVAVSQDNGSAVDALRGVSRPGGAHSRATVVGDQTSDPPL